MDQGRPLEKSPPGPWTSHIESKAAPLPVLQHHHKMAFRTTTNRLVPDANASAEVQQSAAILPLQYDSLLALVDLARRAPQDPISMCIPLFAHSAFSEVQFLNLMESRIQIQMATIAEGVPADALETLQYVSNILNRHAQQLKDSTRALCKLAERSNQGLTGVKRLGPEAETARNVGAGSSNGAFTTKGLLEDYEQLHVRCVDLSKMCSQGITLAMNKASIDESRKAMEQSERLKKLTLLATLFIPLSFSTSLFGMNIDILGQGTVSFWWFFVLCVPITLCAYIVYLWDFGALRRSWVSFWKGCRGVRRDMMGGRGEKEPNHFV
jgi:Mg2+ and Co2+ transporter CorA